MIALIAILFIPVLYAGMFLWAFWDPYDKLDEIPVAIVNDDAGYHFEGEDLKLGNELVEELEKEDAFQFHIVDRQTGYKGLEKEDYYVLIEIPSTFSEHATTVIEDEPQQVELVYTPNESYNFLAAQIGETAMLQIEQALEEEITEAYANVIVDHFDTAIDRLHEAEDGVNELHGGAEQLYAGTDELHEHLQTLATSMITFSDGVHAASDGFNQLEEGSLNLATGMLELFENSVKLTDAAGSLANGSDELYNGLETAQSGMNELLNNVPALVDGTGELTAGLNELDERLPKAIEEQLEKELQKQSDTIIAGVNELRHGVVSGLENDLADQLIAGISNGLTEAIKIELGDLNIEIPDELIDHIAKEIGQVLYEEQVNQIETISATLKENDIDDATIEQVIVALSQNENNQIEQKITTILKQGVVAIQNEIGAPDLNVEQIEQKITDSTEDGIRYAIDQVVVGVNQGFDQFENELTSEIAQATDGLDKKIASALNGPIGQLINGAEAIYSGQQKLQQSVAQLATGANELGSGAGKLRDSQQSYYENMMKFTTNFEEAKDGANELHDGVNVLQEGATQLVDGADKLVDGTEQLSDGASELNDGMGEIYDGTKTFQDEVSSLADQADDIKLTKKTSEMIADPVYVQHDALHEVPNYGTGFAPYFLSLGLFVGALLLSIVYPLREPSVVPTSGANWFIRKLLAISTVGIIQALIASFVLLYGLKIEVQNVPLFLLFAIITSLTFITLIQFLVTCFDDPGRFIAIIILILQLTTSAGTFPLEVIPDALKPFNAILPMTYSVHGFKAVISSGDYVTMWKDAGVLFIFIAISMALTLSYFIKMYKRKFGTLQEANAS